MIWHMTTIHLGVFENVLQIREGPTNIFPSWNISPPPLPLQLLTTSWSIMLFHHTTLNTYQWYDGRKRGGHLSIINRQKCGGEGWKLISLVMIKLFFFAGVPLAMHFFLVWISNDTPLLDWDLLLIQRNPRDQCESHKTWYWNLNKMFSK